ncbi:hypothetical protein XM38_001220 [Halomicronema hongdechloris C2206]|uniref:Uncharacterized protein n=1 Tax=Halomicronema hongdechloris C2206 TaxID=1641165 RepID=A0A1Z3HFY4_9CYAN|nr:hypothetical protein [Halomicronema hongdechloris]ASC69196.1 hypothetical protein XM38_001220 [Halomicronema hongdechloris C2206]
MLGDLQDAFGLGNFDLATIAQLTGQTAVGHLDPPVHRFMAAYGLGPSLPKDGFPGAGQSL